MVLPSLKLYFRETYGADVEKMASSYSRCLLKISKFKNHVFSARCKRVGILPQSLRIKSPADSARGYQIARAAGYQFLEERLRLANRRVEKLEAEKKWMEIGLQRTISEEDYQRLMEVSRSSAERVFLRTREKQQRKFEN